MINKAIRTFLGANSAKGFFSFFGEIEGFGATYILKGGPGTGKSGFMKRAASAALAEDMTVEYIHCSSDPCSLDAVNICDISLALADGTPPHAAEPKYPGALGGIIDLGRFWDECEIKKSAEDVFFLSEKISAAFAHGYKYLAAAGALCEDISSVARESFDNEKARRFTDEIVKRNIVKSPASCGNIKKRFLSGITPDGVVSFCDTLYSLCGRVLVIKDKYFLSDTLVSRFAEKAADAGHTVYAFFSPLLPHKMLHAAVPSLDLAVATDGYFASPEPQNAARITMSRFMGEVDKKRLTSSQKIMNICVNEAISSLRRAKELHDDLEDIYVSAMDFNEVDTYCGEFIDKHIKIK